MKEDMARVLVVFPESWSRPKREYVKLVSRGSEPGSSNSLIWLGRKSDFSPNGNKAKINYDEEDIRKLDSAPDLSVLQIRSDRGEFSFEKQNGKWVKVEGER